MRKGAEIGWWCVFALIVPILVFAQTPPSQPTLTPAAETGEPEGDAFHLPPVAVDPRVHRLADPMLEDLVRDLESGRANLIERRTWDWLYPRLTPFDKPIPADWRIKTQAIIKAMEADQRNRAEAAGTPEAALLYWSQIGTGSYLNGSDANSGRATAIWVDAGNKNHILLGTADGGVWSTTDQGSTWTAIFDTQATTSIGGIGVDPNNTSVIYVGTGEGNNNSDWVGGVGMYKSTNGGSTWSLLTLPAWTYSSPWHSVRKILVDPNNSSNVYAVVDGGLLYSTSAGTSWTLTTCGAAASSTYMGSDLVLDPYTSPTTIFVALGYYPSATANGIYRATAGAGPWTTVGSSSYGNGFPAASIGRINLVIGTGSAGNGQQVYALIQSSATYQNLGIFYAANALSSPVTWTSESTQSYCSSQCWYDMAGAVDPSNPAHLAVGGLDDYMSATNGSGSSLTQVSVWNSSGSVYSHADHHFFAMPDSTTLYDANDGGFFVATLNWATPSATWVNKNAGLYTLQFYGLAQHPSDATKIGGGLQDNGQAYYNGSSWSQVIGGDGGKSAWDQTSNSYAYEEYVYSQIRRNSNMTGTPTSWTCLNFGGCTCGNPGCVPDSRCAFIAPFTLDANAQGTLYAGTYRVWSDTTARTSTLSTAFSAISPDLTGGSGYITNIHSAKNNGTSGTIYAGTSTGKAQVTVNGGTTWTDVSTGLSGASVTSFATDPTNGLHVLVTVSGYGASHVYRSLTGSTAGTWTDITGALPAQPFNCVALDPADSNHAYAGSDYGIFENTAVWSGNTWTSLQGNLPSVSVQELGFNVTNGRLRAATHGRGIWEFLRTTTSPQEVSPSQNMTAAKGSGTSVNVTFAASCGDVDTTVYTGSLATLQGSGISWTNRYCNKGATGALSFDPGAANIYFVVVGNNGAATEGSYGKNSSNVELPAAGAGAPCSYSQNLAGTCP